MRKLLLILFALLTIGTSSVAPAHPLRALHRFTRTQPAHARPGRAGSGIRAQHGHSTSRSLFAAPPLRTKPRLNPITHLRRWFHLIQLPKKMRQIVKQMLRNHPDGGIAAFDADGTLWSGDVGTGFFEWMLKRRAYPANRQAILQRRWAEYKAGTFRSEDMYNLMVTAAEGMTDSQMQRLADDYVRTNDLGIYQPMAKLVRTLERVGITPYVVSGSPRWVVAAGARLLGIPAERVIGLGVKVAPGGRLTNTLDEPLPWQQGKAQRILEKGRPLLVAGNSYGDIEMLNIAKEVRLVVNPGDRVLRKAKQRNWSIHSYKGEDEISKETLVQLLQKLREGPTQDDQTLVLPGASL